MLLEYIKDTMCKFHAHKGDREMSMNVYGKKWEHWHGQCKSMVFSLDGQVDTAWKDCFFLNFK